MTDDEIREKLQREIAKTEALIAEYKEMSKPVSPDVAIGRISRMDAINNKAVTESALREAQDKLHSLRQVLAQVGTAEFGLCVKCKQPIPPGRILIRPQSLYCVKCAR